MNERKQLLFIIIKNKKMISKNYIKKMEFKNLEDIFNYIILSKINGNYKQTKELVKKLSNTQFKEFIEYVNELYENEYIIEFNKMRFNEWIIKN